MKKLLFMAIVCAVISAPAFADLYGTVDVDWKGLIRGSDKLMIASPYGAAFYEENYVGVHLLDLGALDTTSPPADTTLPSNSYLVEGLIQAFCIDLQDAYPAAIREYDAISLNSAPDTSSGGPMGNDKAYYMAQLLNTNTWETADKAAAVQVALWEILYETPTSWDTTTGQGNFYLDTGGDAYGEAAIATAANTMLTGLSKASSFSQYTALSNETGKTVQDFVLVPVPAAVLLGILGLGVAGLCLGMRRFA